MEFLYMPSGEYNAINGRWSFFFFYKQNRFGVVVLLICLRFGVASILERCWSTSTNRGGLGSFIYLRVFPLDNSCGTSPHQATSTKYRRSKQNGFHHNLVSMSLLILLKNLNTWLLRQIQLVLGVEFTIV